jgi:hypothetical protein
LEYWVRVRGSIIIFGILNSSFVESIFFRYFLFRVNSFF